MLATVRKRRGLVTAVEDYSTRSGEISRLVTVEYMDGDGVPEDQILWERERGARLIEPKTLPRVENDPPMLGPDYDAVQRGARWAALSPHLLPPGAPENLASPIASPLFGAIQVEDFQLVPLVRALRMPRVSLLLADDVGLGKSIEAGLILSELILRRRIRRVLILCPASLRYQWQQEMKNKYSLTFDIVDRPETHALRKRLGMDANPWRTFPRTIASYHYLKQPDVLEQFLAVCHGQHPGSATLPWDLLIVDEAHNCMPSSIGEDSALARMLTEVARHFEHKVFLTATPHNGYTRCFSGLLEQLDPVRFTRKDDLSAAEQRRVQEIVIRRLKKEINATDETQRRPARFPEREIIPQPLFFGPGERELAGAFETFRAAVKALFASAKRSEQMAGSFAIEVLSKRLLSCPYAFADSWWRLKEGLIQDEEASEGEVRAAERAVREDTDDDAETESRIHHAARITGAWLRKVKNRLANYIKPIDERLNDLGLVPDAHGMLTDPVEDARLDRLFDLIRQHLREGKGWGGAERLIIFTEYKTTLDYLHRRLLAKYKDAAAVRVLFGGMDDRQREAIKRAFNDPADPVRILIGTDAASEGQNLQETARMLLHYDIPWNPSRLDQRNGRLDRHGQARDVHVYHFTSDEDADLRFLGKVIKKVENIRTDLGSMSELFDAAFERRFQELHDADLVDQMLTKDIDRKRKRLKSALPKTEVSGAEEQQALEWLVREIDFSPEALRSTLEVALGMGAGKFIFDGPDSGGRFRLPQVPERWRPVVDTDLRLTARDGAVGPLPAILFDARHLMQTQGGRTIFRPAKDSALLHLGHPVVRQALLLLARTRFPGTQEAAASSRWIVRFGDMPAGMEALVLLTVEELAINELRETFHHWIRTLRFPVRGGRLGELLTHVPAAADQASDVIADHEAICRARDLWDEVRRDVEDGLLRESETITARMRKRLEREMAEEVKQQKSLFAGRQAEIDKEMQKKERDIQKRFDEVLDDVNQLELFKEIRHVDTSATALSEELERERHHHQAMREFIAGEQRRVLEELLPRRFKLRGQVQLFPVTVEIRLPASPAEGRG